MLLSANNYEEQIRPDLESMLLWLFVGGIVPYFFTILFFIPLIFDSRKQP